MAPMPSRLLCVTRAFGTGQGGMERLSYEMIAALKQQPDFTVSVIAHQDSRYLAPLFVLRALPKVWRAAKTADVVHIGDPLLSFLGWVIHTFLKKPVIVTVHGLDIVYANPLYQLYLKVFFTKFSSYWAISHYVAQLLETQWHLPAQSIKVLTPGLTDALYQPQATRQALETILGRSLSNTQVLLTTGRLIKRKGVAWFITNVLSHLSKDVVYVVAGSGPDLPAIQAAIVHQNVQNQVVLLGRVSANDLQTLYNTVDAYIQPNITIPYDIEGFGLVVLEAALCGRPVFAAQLEGLTDAIQNNHNGILLPSGHAEIWITTLQQFLADPAKHQPSGNDARRYTYDHYLWPRVISSYVAALKQVLQ